MTTTSFEILAGSDDGYSTVSGSGYNQGDTFTRIGNASSLDYRAFYRFINVSIPAGALIEDAYIRVRAYGINNANTCNVLIHFEDEDDTTGPSSGADLISRSLTTGTAWTVPQFTAAGNWYNSSDITSELQTIVDRAGWASGQDMTIHIVEDSSSNDATRRISTFNQSSSNSAELHVTYSTPVVDTIAVTEDITTVLSFSGELPETSETVAVVESISIELFQAWLLGSAGEDVGISEYVETALEDILDTLNTDTIALTENIDVSLALNASVVESIGLEEYLNTALDIPASWIALANAGLTKEFYYFTLTGDADGTTDIEIPIESFQARKRTGEATYLSVVIRDFANYAAAIAARSNGEMVVEMAYEYDGDTSIRQEILRADLENINLYEGALNRSIGLTGHKTITFSNRSVTLENAIYKATVEGRLSFRFSKCDPHLNPGDTLVVGSDSMTVDYITYVVSAGYKAMEVREIG